MKRSSSRGGWPVPAAGHARPGGSSSAGPEDTASAESRGTPGRWTKLNTAPAVGLGEAALHRTADGVLHVVHKQELSASQLGYVHSAVSTAGSTLAQSAVDLGPVTTVSDFPKLMGTPTGGLRIVLNADFADPLRGGKLVQAVSGDNGATWSVGAEALTKGVAFGTTATLRRTSRTGTPSRRSSSTAPSAGAPAR